MTHTLRISGAIAALVLATPLLAQSKLSFSLGGGPTIPAKYSSSRFDTGFNITAGVGVHRAKAVGLMAEFGFTRMAITRAQLTQIGVPDGSARVYSVTLNPIVHLVPEGRFDVYLVGGGGYYRRTIEFTQPSSAIATAFDPFYGIFYPVEMPTTTVLGSYSQNKGGLNGGAGIAVRLAEDGNATLFAESRYHYVYTAPVRTAMLPVTIGFRW
jgi:hypothetical protein